MWYNMDRLDAPDHIRHDCDERDKFTRYGWTHHDGRNFGVQELADAFSGVNITTEWVKHRDNDGTLRFGILFIGGIVLHSFTSALVMTACYFV